MKSTLSTCLLALVAGSIASPVHVKRVTPYSDSDVLNYALTLEHLEDAFYKLALGMYNKTAFIDAGYPDTRSQIEEISYDESTHVAFLTGALKAANASAVSPCIYEFGLDSVDTFLATASVLEGVGVSAYLGAAASINNGAYLTAAASILTVEARHNAYIRKTLDSSPFPSAFDIPLDFNNVYSLAAPFIVSCPPSNPPFLKLKAFPTLVATTTAEEIMTGTTLSLKAGDIKMNSAVYAAFVTVKGPVFVDIISIAGVSTVKVPAGLHGQNYLVLTNSKDTVSDDTTLAGPTVVEIAGSEGGF